MDKYDIGPRDFDNPSLFFLLEDFVYNLLGIKFIYYQYSKSFEIDGSENI